MAGDKTTEIKSATILEELASDPSRFDSYTIRAIAEAAIRKIARLEGYSEGLRDTLTAVRRAAGCNHD